LQVDLVGAITTNVYMLLIIAMFAARISGQSTVGRWIGITSTLVIFPLIYLFIAGRSDKPVIYFVWLGLMIAFALFELVADQILKIDLRSSLRTIVPYVMFFFAATGGMIGVAGQAGKAWTIGTSIVFLVMAVMAFVQRKVTGL
jgi:hypothetical protein